MYFNDTFISWVIISSSIGVLISVLCFLIGLVHDEDWNIAGVIIGLVSLILGFGLLATVVNVREEKLIITEYETAYTSTSVTLVFDGYSEIFYDVKTYNLLKTSGNCDVYYLVKYNSYGGNGETPHLIIDKKY